MWGCSALGRDLERGFKRRGRADDAYPDLSATDPCGAQRCEGRMIKVKLWAGLRPLADNQDVVCVEARTIREMLRELEERYPALATPFRDQVAVAVDGVIYRNDWSRALPENADVMLMRRISGG